MPPPAGPPPVVPESPLDRARRKAYRRLLPVCFISYVIAFVDRSNVSIAKLTMTRELPGFDNAVIGFGAGIFFLGYFLLEIPGTLLVEKWSARLWISRIMITWGLMAALTAAVRTPFEFYLVRFLLGLAEAGFYPGVIVYFTHWFPSRDRARTLALFFVATPFAQIVSPKISNLLLRIGTDEVVGGVLVHHPKVLSLSGWQWIYIGWGVPAVVMGVVVLFALTDRPAHTVVPMAAAALGLLVAAHSRGHLPLTVACFMVAYAGFKAYLPAFWAMPSLFLTEVAAAGSVGLINSVGNLGGFLGPWVIGSVEALTGSFEGGLYFLAASMAAAAFTVLRLGLGRAQPRAA